MVVMIAALPGAWGGESGLNVIVVVNQTSSNSVQLGNDYCEQRNVSPQNLFRMNGWADNPISWSQNEFETYLLNPLLAMVSIQGLTNQANIVLLSMDIPYRVYNGGDYTSTTSALFYGFKTNAQFAEGCPDTCALPDEATNSYSFSELPFPTAPPQTAATNAFLALMLTDTNLAQAETTLQRGVFSDCTYPTQTVYLEKTSDSARNVRFIVFDNAVQECRARADNALLRTNSDSTAFTGAFGLETGLAVFSVPTNAFIPGAVADSLTSFGGFLRDNNGQTVLLAFLEAGACGSYGTVVEPCNWTFKFPDPMVYFYQNRGFCLAEAYYQSLALPFQGLMVGEPLSAPFAHPGSGGWLSPSNGSVVSGVAPFSVTFTAASTNFPLTQVDLFVDGSFVQTLTNLPPSPGNILSATINGVTASYTVVGGDSLSSAAGGLASALAAMTNQTGVQPRAVGDRLVLRSQNAATLGGQISVQAGATPGSAGALTSFANTVMPTFLDSIANGYHFVQATSNPNVGDWLQLMFIKTNGTQVTVAVTNTQSGATISTLLQSLMNQINATPALQTGDGAYTLDLEELGTNCLGNGFYGFFIYAASPGWPASQIQTIFTGSTNLQPGPGGTNTLDDNAADLQPRAHIYLSCGAASLPVQFALDTRRFPDGFHTLTAVAYEGTSVRTQTRVDQNVQFRNTSLSATFSALAPDTNGNPQFSIACSATNISLIELFSTGGLAATVTNQPAADIAASAATLGVGLHPFYAIVTDSNGNQYQTPALWEQVPVLQLSVSGPPQTLNWPAIPGRQYTVLTTTNLVQAFQVAGAVLATSTLAQWTIVPPPAGAAFYRVSVAR